MTLENEKRERTKVLKGTEAIRKIGTHSRSVGMSEQRPAALGVK